MGAREGKGGHGSPQEWGVAAGEDREEEEEEGGVSDEGGGQTLQSAHKMADHYQSLEDLRAVSWTVRNEVIAQPLPISPLLRHFRASHFCLEG